MDRAGRPRTPEEAASHEFLRYGASSEPWLLKGPNGRTGKIAAAARLRVDNGDTIHDWALAGLGIALKSEVDVAQDIATGRLERVLPEWDEGPAPIVALYPSAAHLPFKTRILLDELAAHVTGILAEGRAPKVKHGN